MKRHIIIAFTLNLIFTGTVIQAQGILRIDSLKKVLATENIDAATMKKYLVLAVSKLQTNNTDAKHVILDWLITVSKAQKGFEQMTANGYYWKGAVYQGNGSNDKALEWYLKALEFSNTIGYGYIENNAGIGLGSYYFYNKQYDKALTYFNKVTEVSKKNDFKAALAANYLNIANVISAQSENSSSPKYGEIIRYMKLALEVAEPRKDTAILIKANIGIGTNYNLLKDYTKAEQYMKQAEKYLSAAGWEQYGADFYGNFAEIYRIQNKYKEAIEYGHKALEVTKEFPDPNFEHEIYGSLEKSYKALGDFENAYKWQTKYTSLKDSVENKERFATMAELETKYQQAVKDKEIIRLGTEQKIKQLELEKQKAIIAGNFWEAERKEDEIKLLSQEKELQDLQLAQQEQVLGKNKLQAKADSQQIQLSKSEAILKEGQIAGQKRTRNYLIGGLGLLGLLAFILYRNITAKKKAYTELQYKSEQIKEQALQLSKQAKQIAQFQSQMNPHFVYNALHNIQGLVLTDEKQKANGQIQSLAQLMRKTFANADKDDIPLEEEINYLNKYIEFERTAFGNNLDYEVTITKEAEGTQIPPMMIQPFIENAIKHAELKKVPNPYIKVLIETENNLLAINIMDNGTGIKKGAAEGDKLSHSLSVIKSRLDLLFKGKADVNNQPVFSIKTMPELPQGTSIKFYLPLNYAY
jgi:tetratricopeptide (TPR) repeat protein